MSKRLKFTTSFVILTTIILAVCLGFSFSREVVGTVRYANSNDVSAYSEQAEGTAATNYEDYFLPDLVFDTTTASSIKTVNIGGFPVGINLKTDGLIILSKCKVVTSKGVV